MLIGLFKVLTMRCLSFSKLCFFHFSLERSESSLQLTYGIRHLKILSEVVVFSQNDLHDICRENGLLMQLDLKVFLYAHGMEKTFLISPSFQLGAVY